MIEAVENHPLQDPLEQALWDWHRGQAQGSLLLHAYSLEGIPLAEEPQVVSPEVFFTQELPEVEALALELCRGRVLDIGAGTGRHSLLLQEEGFAVAALDRSPVALQIMAERGVRCRIAADLFHWPGPEDPFDTLLLLMNGVGLVGSPSGLEHFLRLARHWIQPTGQLLLDSTDLSDTGDLADLEDLPAERELENWESPSGKLTEPAHLEADGSEDCKEGSEPTAKVVNFVAEYNGQRGDPFPWLFVDPETLLQCAHANGWQGQIVYQELEGAFLARLTPL
ncbi:MAG TPA: class I SAM-dependent methyltransferase [Synechococcus sp. M44_DOE_062]|nr:class I SAM-dependent methyltransferase [Synechococcus sp. M44_DOE_062]